MEQKICIGKIVKTIGIKGEVKIIPLTDNINRFKSILEFYIDSTLCMVEKISIRNNFVSAKIVGIDSPEQALAYKDKLIFVDRENAIKLQENQYFIVDLIGCKIYDEQENFIGEVLNVENYGASDIIVFKKDNKEHSIPFLDKIFTNVDLENQKIVVTNHFYEVMI